MAHVKLFWATSEKLLNLLHEGEHDNPCPFAPRLGIEPSTGGFGDRLVTQHPRYGTAYGVRTRGLFLEREASFHSTNAA